MDKLPVQVLDAWKTAAAGTDGASSAPDATKPAQMNKKSMSMPMN
jgi:hypothetical protein